jgi:hypothetical protein
VQFPEVRESQTRGDVEKQYVRLRVGLIRGNGLPCRGELRRRAAARYFEAPGAEDMFKTAQ